MLRISTTQIESYRKFMNYDYDTPEKYELAKEELIKQFKRESEPNIYMTLGTTFHSILENPSKYYNNDFYKCNDIIFSNNCINKSLTFLYKYEMDVKYQYEIKATKIYDISGEKVTIVAKVDAINGNLIIENKTAWSLTNFKGIRSFYDEYYDSLQWKFYLDIFESDKVIYNIFVMDNKKEPIELLEYKTFEFDTTQYSYSELRTNTSLFLEFIKENNLTTYFERM